MRTTVQYFGESRTPYTFSIPPDLRAVGELKGLYVWMRDIPGTATLPYALYFGETTDGYSNRFFRHERWNEAISLGMNLIGILPVHPKSLQYLPNYESDLIRGCPTPLNIQHNAPRGLGMSMLKEPPPGVDHVRSMTRGLGQYLV